MKEEVKSKKSKQINLLWTGGWDSTFRVVQLAQKEVIIQPYYLKDDRKSEQYELEAIQRISSEIRRSKSTKCTLKELKTRKVADIEPDPEISEAYNHLLEKTYFGSQYDWLARFAKTTGDLELMIHSDDKAFGVIQTFGSVVERHEEGKGRYHVLDQEASSEELAKLFGKFHFPLLNHEKLDMKREAEEKGYGPLMHQTWFCYTPIDNKPCGLCNPCRYTIEEGMGYRLSKEALKRYEARKYKNVLKKIRSKISRSLNWP